MTKTRDLILLAVFLSTVSVIDAAPHKQPWEWTLEERLAVRFDPEHIREREAAKVAGWTSAQRESARALERATALAANGRPEDPRTFRHGVDGKRNPELFLPHELFDAIMTGFEPDPERRRKQRWFYEEGIRQGGFDPTLFWLQLESVSGDYITLRFHAADSSGAGGDARCHARYDALGRARELFGRERFDRFLYVGVAPGSSKESVTVGVDPTAEVRRAASGCR